jgi:hypothetical protein
MIKLFKNTASFRIKWYKEFTDVGYQNTLIEIDNNNLVILRKNLEPIILDYNQIEEPITSTIEELRMELYCWIDDALKLSIPLLDTHIKYNDDCFNLQNFNGDLYWRGEKLTTNNNINNNFQYYNEFIIKPDLINVLNPITISDNFEETEYITLINPGPDHYVEDYIIYIQYKKETTPYSSIIEIDNFILKSFLLREENSFFKFSKDLIKYNIENNNIGLGNPIKYRFLNPKLYKTIGDGILKFRIFYNLNNFNF